VLASATVETLPNNLRPAEIISYWMKNGRFGTRISNKV
jgi:hypothetical protein